VPAPGFAGGEGHHPVKVNRRLTGNQADASDNGAGFDLMVDSDVAKRLAVVIKPSKDSVLKSPDSADLSSLDIFVFGQFG
jgi:hypothetical protein